jgi:mersacidin/lichenicidin family type 2 lantibiotic
MSHRKIIKAWKNEDFRLSLSEAERAHLPEHPAGLVELSDDQLGSAAGGINSKYLTACCTVTFKISCYTAACASIPR